MSSQGDGDSSPYFKKPQDISSAFSTKSSSASVAESVYAKSLFFRNQTASNPSTPGPNRSPTPSLLAENKSLTSDDRTLAGNKSLPSSSTNSLASCSGSTSEMSDFRTNRRKARNSFDTSSIVTPG